jgi:hypothetical protein
VRIDLTGTGEGLGDLGEPLLFLFLVSLLALLDLAQQLLAVSDY